MQKTEYTKKDFLWTKWTSKDIEKIVPKLIKEKKEIYEKIKKIPNEKRTFKNTIYALASSDDNISHFIYKIYLLLNVSPNKKIRESAQKAIDFFEKEMVDILHDKKIYEAVKAYKKQKEKLNTEDAKLLKDISLSYKRMGFDLPEKKQKELKEKQKKLAKFETQFSKNINDCKDQIRVSKKELLGLEDSYIKGLKKKNGKYVVGLQYPELIPFMQMAKNSKKRKELADKSAQKGGIKNLKLAKEILKLREDIADILGYETYADYKIEPKMAKKKEKVFSFIESLLPKLKNLAKKDIAKIEKLKREDLKDKKAKIKYYDIAYYANKLKEKEYGFDVNKLKEYFPFKKVKEGVFEVYAKLFSIEFEKLENYPLWHKDVELYKIKDKKQNTIAYFVLDMYPREGKYGHAAVFEIVDGHQKDFSENTPFLPSVVSMVANIPKPKKNNPSLMSHYEIETFFHEFGHIMHQCLCQSKYSAQLSFKTAWDFVEAPSQMLENWVWNKKILKILSGHYKSGAKIPDELAEALISSKKHFSGYDAARQLSLALFDMELHIKKTQKKKNYPLDEKELTVLWKKTMEKWLPIKISSKNLQPAAFSHIFGGGYSAGYYGYMWSKVYASDMFLRFKKEGILNKKTGGDYKKYILQKGASREELKLVESFLGRKANNKAFLKELGL